jgi:hypothetical protein
MTITNEILQSLINDSWPDYVTSGSPVSNRVYTRRICQELLDARAANAQKDARIAELESENAAMKKQSDEWSVIMAMHGLIPFLYGNIATEDK